MITCTNFFYENFDKNINKYSPLVLPKKKKENLMDILNEKYEKVNIGAQLLTSLANAGIEEMKNLDNKIKFNKLKKDTNSIPRKALYLKTSKMENKEFIDKIQAYKRSSIRQNSKLMSSLGKKDLKLNLNKSKITQISQIPQFTTNSKGMKSSIPKHPNNRSRTELNSRIEKLVTVKNESETDSFLNDSMTKLNPTLEESFQDVQQIFLSTENYLKPKIKARRIKNSSMSSLESYNNFNYNIINTSNNKYKSENKTQIINKISEISNEEALNLSKNINRSQNAMDKEIENSKLQRKKSINIKKVLQPKLNNSISKIFIKSTPSLVNSQSNKDFENIMTDYRIASRIEERIAYGEQESIKKRFNIDQDYIKVKNEEEKTSKLISKNKINFNHVNFLIKTTEERKNKLLQNIQKFKLKKLKNIKL